MISIEGLSKTFDTQRNRWYVRFLVPRDVSDGRYSIAVRIEHAGGRIEWKDIDYLIDGTAPELEVQTDEMVYAGELMHIAVDPLEPVKEVYVTLPGVSKQRIDLTLNVETGLYEGEIRVPDHLEGDELMLRVVARDLARNKVQRDVKVAVYFDCGC